MVAALPWASPAAIQGPNQPSVGTLGRPPSDLRMATPCAVSRGAAVLAVEGSGPHALILLRADSSPQIRLDGFAVTTDYAALLIS